MSVPLSIPHSHIFFSSGSDSHQQDTNAVPPILSPGEELGVSGGQGWGEGGRCPPILSVTGVEG